MHISFTLESLDKTTKLATAIANSILPNFVVALSGNLGAGKTTLIRQILSSLGVRGVIKSPTFTLVEPYQLNRANIYHFDLYRFSDPEEWFDAGFDEYFDGQYICFIEWAEKAQGLLPQLDWQVNIEIISENERKLIISTLTDTGEKCLMNLINSDVI